MQIILVQSEIETAIRDFFNKRIRLNEDQTFQIELNATRGADGFKATIDIVDIASVPVLVGNKEPSAPIPQGPITRTAEQPVAPSAAPTAPVAAARPQLPPAVPVGPTEPKEQAAAPATPATPAPAAAPVAEPATTGTAGTGMAKPLFGSRNQS